MRLPPLYSLVVFEALARCGKIVPAAEELCVTPGAVSKQIGKLEEWFGRALFERVGRRLVLAPDAADLLSEVQHALNRIERVTNSFKTQASSHQLRVSAPPTFLTRWLIPRLGKFQQAFPEIRVQLENRRDRNSALPPNTDLAVRRGAGEWSGFASTHFMNEAITPVCSAEIGRERENWKVPDLLEYACLRAGMRPHDWDDWCSVNDISVSDWHSVFEFDHTFLALDAALDSLGFAMGPVSLLVNDLASGSLYAPFPDRIVASEGYYVLHNIDDMSPAVIAFRDWLSAEGRMHDGESSKGFES